MSHRLAREQGVDAEAGLLDDPRWAGSQERLVERLRDEILAAPGQRITFARFMERALSEPGLGYYATSDLRPTRDGDFLTAPELHPFFGRCVGRFLAAAWARSGSPARYVVSEFGAGRGTLRATALAGLEADGSPLADAIEWQRLDLPGQGAVRTAGQGTIQVARQGPSAAAVAEAHDLTLPDVVLANEYLDALPAHRLVMEDGLREAWVGWRDGWFDEIFAEPSDAALERRLADEGIELRDGQRAEVCLAAPHWITEVAGTLAADGLLLVIDYGHEADELYGHRRMAGSLLTYREHAVAEDPFGAIGRTDITAHVDLTALRRAAEAAGLELLGRTDQGRFLASLGLGELLSRLGRDPATDPRDYLLARSAVARLLDPRHLGAFAVLAWGRPGSAGLASERPALPGFELAL